MQLPSRSTLLGGLGGLATWGICVALTQMGIQVPQDAVGGAVALVTALLVHFIPDSIQDQANALNVDVETLAKWLPQAVYPKEGK
jgi:hypothetical protein